MKTFALPLPVFMPPDTVVEPPAPPPTPPPTPPAGDPPTAPKDPPTALDGGAGDKDKTIVVPGDFPEDWRVKLAGDAKAAKQLDRFKAPTDLWKSYTELQTKMAKGKTANDAPDGEKDPDGLKAWRKDNGIPDEPTGYELPKPVLDRLTDADKPVLASFTEFAHKKNLPPSAVAVAAEWYVASEEAATAAQRKVDADASEATADALRKEWGPEFKNNMEVIKRFQEEITPGVPWANARLDDGRRIGDIPEVAKMMATLALQKYGDVAFIGGANESATMTRKAEIEKFRSTNWQEYQGDEKMQKEYLDILAAEDRAGRLKK